MRKAQVLIIFLWILTLLTVLTVSLGEQIAMFLKFTRAREAILKANYLAYAGINRAITELKKDSPDYDGITDKWVDNKDIFEKVQLSTNPDEYATIASEGKYGVVDQESKININKATQAILLALMDKCNISSPQEVAQNILMWRGDMPDNGEILKSAGYPPKGKPFVNLAELMLIPGIEADDFKKISKVITVYGDGTINLNTASPDVISIICNGIAKEKGYTDQSYAASVTGEFLTLRNTEVAFQDTNRISLTFSEADKQNIFDALKGLGGIKSDNFLIAVSGNAGRIKTKGVVVYNRSQDYLESWYAE